MQSCKIYKFLFLFYYTYILFLSSISRFQIRFQARIQQKEKEAEAEIQAHIISPAVVGWKREGWHSLVFFSFLLENSILIIALVQLHSHHSTSRAKRPRPSIGQHHQQRQSLQRGHGVCADCRLAHHAGVCLGGTLFCARLDGWRSQRLRERNHHVFGIRNSWHS